MAQRAAERSRWEFFCASVVGGCGGVDGVLRLQEGCAGRGSGGGCEGREGSGGRGVGSYEPPVRAVEPTGTVAPRSVAAARPAPVPAAPAGTTIIVGTSDTLEILAQRYHVSTAEILQANGYKGPRRLQPGQQLVIPSRSAALGALTGRAQLALPLLNALKSGRFDRKHLSALHVRQMRNLHNADVDRLLDEGCLSQLPEILDGTSQTILFGERTHAADRMSPHASFSVHLAEAVVQQHVAAARRIRARIRTDHRVEAEYGFEPFALEPMIEQFARAAAGADRS